MEISISDDLWERIQWKVGQVLYPSIDAVVEQALDLLDQRDVTIAIVRDMVQKGIDDLENGRYKVYSKENRNELFEDIKQRALKLEAEHKQPRRV